MIREVESFDNCPIQLSWRRGGFCRIAKSFFEISANHIRWAEIGPFVGAAVFCLVLNAAQLVFLAKRCTSFQMSVLATKTVHE